MKLDYTLFKLEEELKQLRSREDKNFYEHYKKEKLEKIILKIRYTIEKRKRQFIKSKSKIVA